MTPRHILILFAHPALERSRVNRRLVEAAAGVEGVRVHDLYEAYPDFHIDVKREQELLTPADALVLQHPFYWYSAPALLKQWLDLVLEFGYAYGPGGDALRGKICFQATTTGGPAEAYRSEGYNRFTIRQLLAPFDQTFRLCGVEYLPPFVLHRSLLLEAEEDLAPHARAYRALLQQIHDRTLDLGKARDCERLNDLVSEVA